MVRLTVAMCLMGLIAGSASAATLTPDLNPLTSARDTQLRDGDFDGDGRLDKLYLTAEESGRVAVHVRFNRVSGARDVRVTSLEARANMAPNLQVVAPGAFPSECGNYASDCSDTITAAHDSLVLGLDSGVSVLVHWQGDHFEQDFVRTDDVMMAETLAGLLAFNP